MFDLVSTKGPNLDYAKAEFAAPIPPSITKDGPSSFNESSLSAYCMFAQLLTSLPPIERVDLDFDLGIESSSGLSNGAHSWIVLYADPAIWRHLMIKNDLHLEYLRCYL